MISSICEQIDMSFVDMVCSNFSEISVLAFTIVWQFLGFPFGIDIDKFCYTPVDMAVVAVAHGSAECVVERRKQIARNDFLEHEILFSLVALAVQQVSLP